MERERKFLVLHPPAGFRKKPNRRIEQGYLTITSKGRGGTEQVRVRREYGRFILNAKRGTGASRHEAESPLPAAAGKILWPLTEGFRLQKTRYRIPFRRHVIELDVYHGSLARLMTAEVEFSSMKALRAFKPPAWFDRELTDLNGWSNSDLAAKGRPDKKRHRRF